MGRCDGDRDGGRGRARVGRDSSSDAGSTSPPFADGTRVQLHSLVGAAELNLLQVGRNKKHCFQTNCHTFTLHHLTRSLRMGRASSVAMTPRADAAP